MAKNKKTTPQIDTLTTEFAVPSMAEFTAAMEYLPNPDEILKTQGGSTRVYRKMKDGHISSVRQKRFAAVTSRPWTIDGSKSDPKKAKVIEEHLWSLKMRNTFLQMLSALDYGYSVHEIVWGVKDTEIGKLILPEKIVDKKQEWFKFSPEGELLFHTKSNTFLSAPDCKFILTRNKPTSDNPYGEAIRSDCFWPLAFKKGGLKFWAIFVEKFGIPKAIGKGPQSMSDEEKKKFLKSLYGLVRDAVAVIPQNGSIELLETKGSGTLLPQESLVKWADAEMSKVWLGETLTTEQTNPGGTQAMATVHNDVRQELTLDDVAMLEESMNQLIQWIWALNWPSEKVVPWMNFILPEDLQMARLERDAKLAESLGVEFNADYISDTYGIDKKYFTIRKRSAVDTGAMFAEPGEGARTPKTRTPDKGEREVAAFADTLTKKTIETNLVKPIEELVMGAESLEEIRDKLLTLYGKIPTDKITGEMSQAFLAADLIGRFEILEQARLL